MAFDLQMPGSEFMELCRHVALDGMQSCCWPNGVRQIEPS